MFPSEYYILRIESGSLFGPRRNKEKRVMKVTILCVGKVKEHYHSKDANSSVECI